MGCTASKEEQQTTVPLAPEVGNRRRLSVLKDPSALEATPSAPPKGRMSAFMKSIAGTDGGSKGLPTAISQLNKADTLLEMLPEGDERFSLIGQQNEGPMQKEFSDKMQALATSGNVKFLPASKKGGSPQIDVGNYGVGVACKKGLKPDAPNQDDFFVLQSDFHCGLYGVFDGHGAQGHEISTFAHQLLPLVLLKSDLFLSRPIEAIRRAFVKTQAQAEKAHDKGVFDANLSGTTGTTCYLAENENALYTGYVGDSRAVIARKENTSKGRVKLKARDLSTDHKPKDKEEKKRIENMGGEVKCVDGDVNDRVFLKGKMCPGLAMSRSLGDLVGRSAGVIADPDVAKYDLNGDDQFFLVCSDGVWEFLSSQDAVDIVAPFTAEDAPKAAEALAQAAWDKWIAEEGVVVDDITVIVVNLKSRREAII